MTTKQPLVYGTGPLKFVGDLGGCWVAATSSAQPDLELSTNGTHVKFSGPHLTTMVINSGGDPTTVLRHPLAGSSAAPPAFVDALFEGGAPPDLKLPATEGQIVNAPPVIPAMLAMLKRLARHHEFLLRQPERFTPMMKKWHQQAHDLIVNPWGD